MIDVSKASAAAVAHFPYQKSAFYGGADKLSLGVGVIYSNVRYPLYKHANRLFDTVAGLVYVLTHECDVDGANERHFNELVLVCPIIPFSDFVEEYAARFSTSAAFGFIPDLAGDAVFRAFYLPPNPTGGLPHGGILYLNHICSTHVQEFKAEEAQAVFALSEYGQRILDYKLQNHLLRPKAEALPRTK